MKKFPCGITGCKKSYDRPAELGRHQQAAHDVPGKSAKAKTNPNRKKRMKNSTKAPVLVHDLTKKDLIAIIQVRIEALHYVKQMLEAM